MTKFFMLAGVLGLASLTAWGSPACSTTPGSNNLIAGDSGAISNPDTGTHGPCSVGGLTFSNFTYNLDEGSFTVDPASVNLAFASQIGETIHFNFNPNLGPNSDLEIEFEITGGIKGATLSFNGSTGFVNEVVCTAFTPDGVCGDGTGTQIANLSVTPLSQTASVSFETSSPVWIFKDINVGATGGLSEVNQGYIVPEPVSMSLMGVGLLGLGLLRRRRVRK